MLCYLNLFDTLRSLSCLVSGSKILSDALRVVSKNKDTSWGTYHTVTNGGPDSCSRHSVTTPRHESSPSLHRACRRRSNAALQAGKVCGFQICGILQSNHQTLTPHISSNSSMSFCSFCTVHVFQIQDNRHRQSWTSESTCVYFCCEFSDQGRGVCCTGRGGSSRNLREPNNPKSLLKS